MCGRRSERKERSENSNSIKRDFSSLSSLVDPWIYGERKDKVGGIINYPTVERDKFSLYYLCNIHDEKFFVVNISVTSNFY